MIDEWSSNVRLNFSPSLISCLYESMSKWLGKFTCPGFCCELRNPCPLENEYHAIACGTSGILYALEIVEGRDQPWQANKKFSDKGKIVGLLLRLTRPIWGSSKVIILDSGFCVIQGITKSQKKGVFDADAALIKKYCNWPKHIRGDRIKQYFDAKDVGYIDWMKGSLDAVNAEIHYSKEHDYVTMLMASYRTLERVRDEMKRIWTPTGAPDAIEIKFKYPKLVQNHFQYQDSVEAHNGSRMYPFGSFIKST